MITRKARSRSRIRVKEAGTDQPSQQINVSPISYGTTAPRSSLCCAGG
jgi:hypothetical protein